MNLREIGTAIRDARKTSGQRQDALARSLGMSRATLSGIENGTIGEIGIRKVMTLCAVLGLELNAQPKRGRPTLQELLEEQRAEKRRT